MAPAPPSCSGSRRRNINTAATCPMWFTSAAPSQVHHAVSRSVTADSRSCTESGTKLYLHEMCWLVTCSEAHVNTPTC